MLRQFSPRNFVSVSVLLVAFAGVGQVPFDGLTYFGIGLKPILPNRLLGAEVLSVPGPEFDALLAPKLGYGFGMNVRHELSPVWAFQTGIYYVRRKFDLELHDNETGLRPDLPFTLISYEIPLEALLYVRVKKRLYLNASAGLALTAYPSNVEFVKFEYDMRTLRKRWLAAAPVANLGIELRTKKDGFFYLGASYHTPPNDIATVLVRYSRDGVPYYSEFGLEGVYFTLDLKYFFYEDPFDSSNPKRKKRARSEGAK